MVSQLDIAEVKRRLRSVRGELNISQREAAARASISKSVLEKYESRENQRIPNTRQLFQLAEAYGVSVDFILVRDGQAELPAVKSVDEQTADPTSGVQASG